MFNRIISIGLFYCMMVFSLALTSSCAEKKYNNNRIIYQSNPTLEKTNKTNKSDYIIVLKDGVDINAAIDSLGIGNVKLIKNLKRGRYLISIEYKPSVEVLQNSVINSKYIKYLQLDLIYKSQ